MGDSMRRFIMKEAGVPEDSTISSLKADRDRKLAGPSPGFTPWGDQRFSDRQEYKPGEVRRSPNTIGNDPNSWRKDVRANSVKLPPMLVQEGPAYGSPQRFRGTPSGQGQSQQRRQGTPTVNRSFPTRPTQGISSHGQRSGSGLTTMKRSQQRFGAPQGYTPDVYNPPDPRRHF